MVKLDYKKEYKDLYMPKGIPTFIDVPPIAYVMVEGKGNPNTSKEYQAAVGILYAISYAIKMSKMGKNQPVGYFDYVVPPLEGLWWGDDEYFDGKRIVDKDKFYWKSMISLPEFVTPEYFDDEPESVVKMNQYMKEHNYICDINDHRYHHEIYLSDPRRCKPENLKTVIRHPVRKK